MKVTVKSVYESVRTRAWERLKRPITFLARKLGYTLLNKQQTMDWLKDCRMATHQVSFCDMPKIADAFDPQKIIHSQIKLFMAPSNIWRYESGARPTWLLSCGLLMTDGRVFNTDYWNEQALTDAFRLRKRPAHRARVLIAPLGHAFDGEWFVGYYDFLFLIAAKMCRIKDTISDVDFQEAVVSYPLVNTSYEKEFFELMGFGADRIFDSRLTAIHPEVSYLGNHANWMHQNLDDVLVLKKQLEPLLRTPRTSQNRIYISRAGRRRILNEADLIKMLEKYNFAIIEDKPRTLVEQYSIYNSASFIIGPHGASFANLLWCEPGTHLLELFTAKFCQNHFLYLSQVLNLRYSAYCQDADIAVDYGAIADDITVSISDLEKCLERLLPAR